MAHGFSGYFLLTFPGISGNVEASFKEVSGLTLEKGSEEILKGGNNKFQHNVPSTAKYSNLVLKRGMIPVNSELAKWCVDTLSGGNSKAVSTKNITVTLLDMKGAPLKSWNFVNARPVKWEVSDMNSMNNEIAIKFLEFSFTYFEIK